MPQSYEITQVVEWVTAEDLATQARRARMDADYRRVHNDPYNTNTSDVGGEKVETGSEFASFTSNEAATFVKKVVALIGSGKVILHVPYGQVQEETRTRYDLKERFVKGLLEQANERLTEKLLEPELHDQMSWYMPVTGWGCVLAHFVNREDNSTYLNLRVWDPRNVYWQIGEDGLAWACLKTQRRVVDIKAEYPDAQLTGEDASSLNVYAFYGPEVWGVHTDDTMLREWTEHGAGRVPVYITPAPTSPDVRRESVADAATNYGESVLAANRPLYDGFNEVMSIVLELLAKAREPSAIAFTEEEDTELEEDPNRKGGVHYLGSGDKFQQLPPPETTKDATLFQAAVSSMLQRGGLPYSSYGDIQFALSGYAIGQLNQQQMGVLYPYVKGIARLYRMVFNGLVDQFVTGRFNPLTLRGAGTNRDYMEATFFPQLLANLPPIEVEIVAELPQDDVARISAAQAARQGPVPLLPDRWLYENFLKLPDAALIDRMIKEQQAERGSPRALAYSMADAAMKQGRPGLTQVWLDDLQLLALQSMMQRGQMEGMAGAAQARPQQGGPPGLPPTTLPFMAQRGSPMPPSAPTGLEGNLGLPRNR